MPVTTVTTEITVTSRTSPQEAAEQAAAIATRGLADVARVEVKRVEAVLDNGSITGYRVTVEVAHGGARDSSFEHEDPPSRRATPEFADPTEALRSHVLLEDLSEDEIAASQRFLVVTPARRGSGLKDVSIDHDRYLAGG